MTLGGKRRPAGLRRVSRADATFILQEDSSEFRGPANGRRVAAQSLVALRPDKPHAARLLLVTPSETAYWGAMAQVIPVLGVGLVLEVRVLASRPLFKENKYYRRMSSTIWVVAALCIALSLTTALSSMRTDRSPGQVADSLALGAVVYAASAVLLSPVLDLILVGNSDLVGRLLAASPKRWRLKRSLRHNAKKLGSAIASHRSSLYDHLSQWDRMRSEIHDQLERAIEVERLGASLGLETPPDLQKLVGNVHDHIAGLRLAFADATARRDEAETRWRAKIREENNYGKWCEYALPQVLDAINKDAALQADFLAASQLAQAGAGAAPVYLPASQSTDEVGFIIEIPAQRLATWRDIPYLVRDSKEFEYLQEDMVDADPPTAGV